MFIAKTLSWYKKPEVQQAMVVQARSKEVGVRFGDSFGKRPDVLMYPNDVLEHAKNKATSFHASEEIWTNPMQITPGMSRSQLDELRAGWDLVLDIDCHLFEYSRIAAHYTIEALKHHGIKGISCKFSGNKGFHIGVPFESFPETINGQPTNESFPEAPKRIATYIKHMIKEPVSDAILKLEGESFDAVKERVNMSAQAITRYVDSNGRKVPKLNAEAFLDIDTILLSSRHLYRMPYSFHEKSELISVPINPEDVLKFERAMAEPDKVKFNADFLSRNVTKGEASLLVMQSYDFAPELPKEEFETKQVFHEDFTEMIPVHCFPDCIKTMLEGMEDGKKRALFVLINFLKCCNWPNDRIEEELRAWNKRNPEPLRETILTGHLRYHLARKEKVLPPNCDNQLYYGAMQHCKDAPGHKGVKNPLQYAKRRARYLNTQKPLKAPIKVKKHDTGRNPKGSSQADTQ
ncbi:MAG: hypothetical protein ABIA93_02500 [Candidatus Woesearchaeota archaeon]